MPGIFYQLLSIQTLPHFLQHFRESKQKILKLEISPNDRVILHIRVDIETYSCFQILNPEFLEVVLVTPSSF